MAQATCEGMEKLSVAPCRLCPRECGVDRRFQTGFCGMGASIEIAKVMLHYYEEPCLAREGEASGAIFFGGCSLRCVYCQNRSISHLRARDLPQESGTSPQELAKIMLKLQAEGASNIDLVTPTHFAAGIQEALALCRGELTIPVVWNTSGYEKPEVLEALSPDVSIFLTDVKYADPSLAERYSRAEDYPKATLAALQKMAELTGPPVWEDGLLKRGTIVRHLVLPGQHKDSLKVLELIQETVGAKGILLSLLAQYTPDFAPESYPELKRRITTYEYEKVLEKAQAMDFEGYQQERGASMADYTPDFNSER